VSQLSNVHSSGSKKTNAVPQCIQGLRHSLAAIADVELRTPLLLTNTDSVWFCGHELELESCYLTTLYSCEDCQRRAVTISHDPSFYAFNWHRRGEITGQLWKLKALHEKTPGVRNPCSFYTAYTDACGLAFEVNGEHGSVQGWEDYSTHAGDADVVTTTLWCCQLAQQSGGTQLLSIIDHQLVQYSSFLYHRFCSFTCITSFIVLLAISRLLHSFSCIMSFFMFF